MAAPADPIKPKILLCITEDWFLLSHFRPLVETLVSIGREVVVATRSSGRIDQIEELGAHVVEFDFNRSSVDPLQQTMTIARTARLIRSEKPDVVHVIAMQPMVLTSAALALARPRPKTVLHLTGLGFLGISSGRAARLLRPIAMRALASVLRQPGSWLIAENPDDVAYLVAGGADPGSRATIVGGAGIDPLAFPASPLPEHPVPRVAFVGRMIRSKGVHVLLDAAEQLRRQGAPLDITLYGKTDLDNPDALDAKALAIRCGEVGVTWAGHVSDIKKVWRESDISVLPAITREGLPRSVIEAATSGRPSVVTDVPGCRHVVRDGIDGLIVPPGDPTALAAALARLAVDIPLRRRMGEAARAHALANFTVDRVMGGIRGAYAALLHEGTETT
jgi:glycosyltransferase involved in cell wall biosynthesis